MNTKRQTIWLVSMLSLMVVLSAYYLFSEDVDKLNTATEKVVQNDIKVSTEVKDAQTGGKAVNGEVTSSTKTEDAKSGKAVDAQVLEKVSTTAKTGADFFMQKAMQRDEDFGKVIESLQNVLADTKKSAADISKANEEYYRLQDQQAKIENLEELLAKNYKNAIVLEEGKKFKAVVQAEKLDAKQAQTIIDMMIKELGVAKDSVSVQYMR